MHLAMSNLTLKNDLHIPYNERPQGLENRLYEDIRTIFNVRRKLKSPWPSDLSQQPQHKASCYIGLYQMHLLLQTVERVDCK